MDHLCFDLDEPHDYDYLSFCSQPNELNCNEHSYYRTWVYRKKAYPAIRSFNSNASIYALRSKRNANNHSGVTNLYSFDEVSKIDFDFAIISNPTSEHKNTIRTLLDFRIPLFIEKPIASSPVDNLIKSIKGRNIDLCGL